MQAAVDADSTGIVGYGYVASYQCLFEIATVPGPGYVCVYNPSKDDTNSTGIDDSLIGETMGDFDGNSAMEVSASLL